MQGAIGGILGGIGGLLGNKKEGGTDAGNAFISNTVGGATHDYQNRIIKSLGDLDSISTANSAKAVQDNPLTKGLFGQGGTMDRTNAEEQQLANTGYQLTPEDRTAYGQASGDIARQFGESEQSLSQSLANRGLSNSGVAGAAFTGLQGNKMEQLAGAQKQIADARMQNNMARLGQTRNFLTSLGGQAQTAQQNDFNNALNKNQTQFGENYQYLQGIQGQNNAALQQRLDTQHPTDTSAMFNGAMGGAMSGMRLGDALGGGGSKSTPMAGGSSSNGGVIA